MINTEYLSFYLRAAAIYRRPIIPCMVQFDSFNVEVQISAAAQWIGASNAYFHVIGVIWCVDFATSKVKPSATFT